MATIQRPGKEGNATSYQGKVAAGYTKILAQEVDADFDAIYTAWNQGVDTVNIKDGAVTAPKLAPGAVTGGSLGTGSVNTAALADGAVTSAKILDGTIAVADLAPALQGPAQGQFTTAITLNPRAALVAGATWIDLRGNYTSDPAFDNTKPTWLVRVDYTGDQLIILRGPPPSGANPVGLLALSGAGRLTCNLADSSVARNQLAVGAPNGPLVFAPNPANFVQSGPGVWATVANLPSITTRGGRVHLQANHGLSVSGTVGGAVCMQRWVRDGAVQVAVWSFNVANPAGVFVPFPGLDFIDLPAAGAHVYTFQVSVSTGCTIIGSPQADSGFQAAEIG